MILSSEEIEKNQDILIRNRITWTLNNDGSVRQLWEILRAEKVISIAFDGLYRKAD